MDARMQELLDKQAIYEVVQRYCRGVDRLDADALRSCYHPDGIDHHYGFDGDREAFIEWAIPGLGALGGTMHSVANHFVIELDGDRALAESYLIAYHWGDPPDDPSRNFTSGARYVDHFERRDGEWKIIERFSVREWSRTDVPPGNLRGTEEGPYKLSRRDRTDPSYAALRPSRP
jgi:SnoaL-like domain